MKDRGLVRHIDRAAYYNDGSFTIDLFRYRNGELGLSVTSVSGALFDANCVDGVSEVEIEQYLLCLPPNRFKPDKIYGLCLLTEVDLRAVRLRSYPHPVANPYGRYHREIDRPRRMMADQDGSMNDDDLCEQLRAAAARHEFKRSLESRAALQAKVGSTDCKARFCGHPAAVFAFRLIGKARRSFKRFLPGDK